MLRKILLLVVLVFIANAFHNSDKAVGEVEPTSGPESLVSTNESKGAVPVGSVWKYMNPEDRISGTAYKIAQVVSVKSLSLKFPYDGSNYGTLSVRQHPQYGLDVIVSVEKGQILCRGERYGVCAHKIRFDDGEVEDFTVTTAADGSSNVIFSAYPKWAVNKIKSARKITVQLLMYKEGQQVLVFDVDSPLDW